MTATETAKTIRTTLKREHGWTSRQVSVRVRDLGVSSAIDVTIKDAAVDPAAVRAVALAEHRVARCARTGEILGGGNCYVDVAWAAGVLDAVGAELVAQLRDLEVGVATWRGWRVRATGDGFFEGYAPGRAFDGEPEVYCWGADFCVRQVVERALAGEPATEPEPEPTGTDTPAAAAAAGPVETAHQRARRERAERRAARLSATAEAQFAAARAETAQIPLGQPILVGHHSERRHRAALERADRKGRAAVETARAAERARGAVALAGRSISSDDPEALEALSAKLAALEAKRDAIKASNRARREADGEGVPAYALANLGANIRRVRQRIAELEAAAEREKAPAIEGDGFTISEHPEDNRVRFTFDARPGREACRAMRRAGFRFSRTEGAWQRHLNAAGVYAAKRMARELFGAELA